MQACFFQKPNVTRVEPVKRTGDNDFLHPGKRRSSQRLGKTVQFVQFENAVIELVFAAKMVTIRVCAGFNIGPNQIVMA